MSDQPYPIIVELRKDARGDYLYRLVEPVFRAEDWNAPAYWNYADVDGEAVEEMFGSRVESGLYAMRFRVLPRDSAEGLRGMLDAPHPDDRENESYWFDPESIVIGDFEICPPAAQALGFWDLDAFERTNASDCRLQAVYSLVESLPDWDYYEDGDRFD
jgi:hypothetical protein